MLLGISIIIKFVREDRIVHQYSLIDSPTINNTEWICIAIDLTLGCMGI